MTPNPVDEEFDESRKLDSLNTTQRSTNRRALFITLIPLLVLPVVGSAALRSWSNNNNDLIAWADDSLPLKQQFQQFTEDFGRPEIILVSWPDCREQSSELKQLAEALSDKEPNGWFDNVATTASIVSKLSEVPGAARVEEIRADLRGILIGRSEPQACLITELGVEGRQQRFVAINKIKQQAAKLGIDDSELKIGGMGAELAWLDYESVSAPARLLPIMGVVSLALCIWLLQSIRLGIYVSAMGAFNGVLGTAIIEWCGVQSDAVLATLPTLGGLLSISLSLHFIGYFKNAATETEDSQQALKQAFQWAWKPTLISATTTACGLLSLMLSRTQTIRLFGMFGAAITISAAILTLTTLPAFLKLNGFVVGIKRQNQPATRWQSWGNFVRQQARLIVLVIALLAALFSASLMWLKTGVHINNLFVEQHEIIQHDQWLEKHIGPIVCIEAILKFPKTFEDPGASVSSRDDLASSMTVIQQLTAYLKNNGFEFIASAASGLPDMEAIKGFRGIAAKARLRQWLDKHKPELITSGLYAETDSHQLWRVSTRIPSMTEQPTSEYCSNLESLVQTFLDDRQQNKPGSEDVEFYVTGLPLLFEQIEQQFIEDLLITYMGGLLLITLTVFVVLRSIRDALVAMIPNVLPAIGVLGGLSLAGIELDVGSVMTASIALGVAVDDTLHFVLWYQSKRRQGSASSDAVQSAIQHCGLPIVQTSVICGCGMAILCIAPFLPTARFGCLIAMMLCIALVGDLLFLPAILFSRKEPQV